MDENKMRKELKSFGYYIATTDLSTLSKIRKDGISDADIDKWIDTMPEADNESKAFGSLLFVAALIILLLCIFAAITIPVILDKGLQ